MAKQKIHIARIKATNLQLEKYAVEENQQNDIVFLYNCDKDSDGTVGYNFSTQFNPAYYKTSMSGDLYWLPATYFKCHKHILI